MIAADQNKEQCLKLGLDIGIFSAKGVLLDDNNIQTVKIAISGKPVEAAKKCIDQLLIDKKAEEVTVGLMGQNSRLVAESLGLVPLLEIEALQAGIARQEIEADFVLSLGHENMHYLELDEHQQIAFFSRNGQCAAGSGSFWYQQATRMGYNDRELAEVAAEAESDVPISGRCAVFAKSDMTHAINEGATQSAVSAGMAKALVDNIFTSVALNRISGPGRLAAVGGVANNKAIIKYLKEYAEKNNVEVFVPELHEYMNAIGAAERGKTVEISVITGEKLYTKPYQPEHPLPPLDSDQVCYMNHERNNAEELDLSQVYIGVDCGSVSTKCVLVDNAGRQIGGVYLPTTGKPALQVLELMKQVEIQYGDIIKDSPLIACTTGSGRFLSQNILNADYAVDEITCQAEGIKQLFDQEEILSIIEIGGEDSKFIQLNRGILSDYNMNPVCAAGTGTFLENLAELLGVKIKEEFSEKAFAADYGVDLGDICTLISQSILASASARGLPLNEQLASLAYSSARNYLSKTVDKRPLTGRVVFAGATAKNHALAAALAAICEEIVYVPPQPELTGALGCALMARQFHQIGMPGDYTFKNLSEIREFTNNKSACKAECKHDHNCMLNVISFADGKKFIYGDRCGRYSGRESSKIEHELPDYGRIRMDLMKNAAEAETTGITKTGPTVGIARCGLYYDYYPFWSAFLNSLGCNVVRSDETNAETLQKGKLGLDSEMCYPMKVIVGHYAELKEKDLDYIFLPEVVDMEALPWAESWPRSFVCPLLQTLRGTVINSIDLNPDKVIYAQLNFHSGLKGVREQLLPVAENILGENFSSDKFAEALQSASAAQEQFRKEMVEAAETMLAELEEQNERVAIAFLSRSYTLYDDFISKKSMHYARKSGMMAVPHEYLFHYLQAWHSGEIKSKYLDPYREEFIAYLEENIAKLDNIYPGQLQKMLSSVLLIKFFNEKCSHTGLPPVNMVLLDPFKCGPNAMMRHFLGGLTNYLRLTLDEHTAAAGMITRLEAFRNTCLSKSDYSRHEAFTSSTRSVVQNNWQKVLIPEPTYHAGVIAAIFRGYGVDAEVIPQGKNGDLSLAQRYVNGEECLPFIQNLQDYLSYLQKNGDVDSEGTVFFQGWACGPCRYGLYAPVQSLAVERAGYGKERVLSVKLQDLIKRFGYGFVIGMYNGMMTMDLLYKMLHRTRPYESEPGRADAIFENYRHKLFEVLENNDFKFFTIFTGKYRQPLENLIRDAADEFNQAKTVDEIKPVIILNGEFYVRLDDRCNQSVISKIEETGGEVSTAPATELFTYTSYIMHLEAQKEFKLNRKPGDFFKQVLYGWLLKIALRDEHAQEDAAGELLAGYEEPAPKEIMERAVKYISSHYGGEPPMTIGRAAAFADRDRVAGAVFVAPFTCMPGSIVEAQQRSLQEELNIPIITVYYDGQDNANRDEMVEGLVFQAKQKLKLKQKQAG